MYLQLLKTENYAEYYIFEEAHFVRIRRERILKNFPNIFAKHNPWNALGVDV